MADKKTVSRTEEAYQDEMWRGAMTPEQQQRFILARFDDLSTGMAGQNERLNGLTESVNALTSEQAGMKAAIDRMEPVLMRLDAANTARAAAEEHTRANRAARFFSQLAMIIAVIIGLSPVLISDVRTVVFGPSPVVWYTVLFAVLAAAMILSAVLRKNEDE